MSKKSKAAGLPAIDIGIGDKDRAAIAAGLSRLLADTSTLYLTTHNFHWNVTGEVQQQRLDVCTVFTSASKTTSSRVKTPNKSTTYDKNSPD